MTDSPIESVPSERYPDALSALEHLLVDRASVRAAVAFATEHGVQLLHDILKKRTAINLEIVVRAADATTPKAIEALAGDVGASVSVVIGRDAPRFHPKLWLIENDDRLTVLSGSGNLTSTGLHGNDEQFETFSVPAIGPQADEQTTRFEQLTARAHAFDVIHNGSAWRHWLSTRREQDHHQRQIKRLNDKLAQFDALPSRDADKEVLLQDLENLYQRTLAERLRTESGGTYNPSRFGQALRRARAGERDPVLIVTTICRHRSGGFNVLQANNRPDLTVEKLVLDDTKPYHDLFGENTRTLCRERLLDFPDPEQAGVPRTQTITKNDIEDGMIRVPTRQSDSFPAVPGTLPIVLHGSRLQARWNPSLGPDRARSGRISIGREQARAHLRPGTTLTIRHVGDLVELD